VDCMRRLLSFLLRNYILNGAKYGPRHHIPRHHKKKLTTSCRDNALACPHCGYATLARLARSLYAPIAGRSLLEHMHFGEAVVAVSVGAEFRYSAWKGGLKIEARALNRVAHDAGNGRSGMPIARRLPSDCPPRATIVLPASGYDRAPESALRNRYSREIGTHFTPCNTCFLLQCSNLRYRPASCLGHLFLLQCRWPPSSGFTQHQAFHIMTLQRSNKLPISQRFLR